MNIYKQLIRQPIKTTVLLFLLTAASTFLSLSLGIFLSARETTKEIESQFLTIALPTNETETVPMEVGNGLTVNLEQSVISHDFWQFLSHLNTEDSVVEGIYRQNYISAWSPSLHTVTSAKEDGKYSWYLNKPYNSAMFIVSITEIGDMEYIDAFGTKSINVKVKADLEETVLLHPDYTPRNKLNLYITFYSEEEYLAAELEVGKTYLIYTDSYSDSELDLRTNLADTLRCSIEEIDWSHISYDLSGYDKKIMKDIVAVYSDKGYGVSLTQNELDSIDTAHILMRNRGSSYDVNVNIPGIDRMLQDIPAAELLYNPFLVPISRTAEEFFASPEGADWSELKKQTEIQYQSVPIIGTDFLESMYLFHQQEAYLIEGKTFSEEDYQNGTEVCIISETIAKESGLKVGDSIDLSFYWGASPYEELDPNTTIGNLMAQSYSQKVGFLGESRTYKIVGIYRQSNLWEKSNYNVTPNTIFVPNKSLTETCYSGQSGIFLTIVLKNGSMETFRNMLTEQGYNPDYLFYFDNGYTEIADTLKGLYTSAIQLFIIASITFAASLLVYLFLFVRQERKTAGLMLSLGAGKSSVQKYIYGISMLPVVIATMLGAIIGIFFMNLTLQKVFSSVSEVLSTEFSSTSAAGHIVIENTLVMLPYSSLWAVPAELLVYSCVILISIRFIIKKSPLELLKNV